jgi:hypothetical protein
VFSWICLCVANRLSKNEKKAVLSPLRRSSITVQRSVITVLLHCCSLPVEGHLTESIIIEVEAEWQYRLALQTERVRVL